MKIAIGCDHGGYLLKETIKKFLMDNNYEVLDLGTNSLDSVDYPKYGRAVAKSIVDKEADFGILICGTGIGISIAANKIHGIRAALCLNESMARLSREHNDANILALGARIVGDVLALDIVKTFLNTEFENGRHKRRVDDIECNLF